MTTVEASRAAGTPWAGQVAGAWREGRDSRRRERAEHAVLALLVTALVGYAARLPVLALVAASCVGASGWLAGPAWVGLLTTAGAALFLEWRTSR
jgi:hypothetical protein